MVGSDGSRFLSISDPPSDDDWYADFSPSVSPDGSRVVFVTSRHESGGWFLFRGTRNLEIATSALGGSDYRRLTDHKTLDTNPVWSPDGRRIAFISQRALDIDGEYNSFPEIYTMAADGSDMRAVTPPLINATQDPPVWSPDGRRIAFVAIEAGTERGLLYTIGEDGSDLRRISETAIRRTWLGARLVFTSFQPAWSPDSTRIAFLTETMRIHTANWDGSDLREVEPDQSAVVSESDLPTKYLYRDPSNLSWSFDGSEIRFLGYRVIGTTENPDSALWGKHAINVDGSGYRTIADLVAPRFASHIAWSPDDSRIAVVVNPAHDLINMVTERENVPQNCGYRGPGGNREPREHQGVRGAAAGEVPEGHQG